jgi:CDGSH-type Zn-finger protein
LHRIEGLLAEESLNDQLKPVKIIVNDTENVDIGACPEEEHCLYVDGTNITAQFHAFKEASLVLSKQVNGGLYVESNVHEIL